MANIPASPGEQNLGEVLPQHPHEERRSARAAHEQVEVARLLRHRQVGVELLGASAPQQRNRIQAAAREVDRWEEEQLCSEDFIRRWRAWLALPVPLLAEVMCGDADGWGRSMRQNSPFSAGDAE